MPKHTITAATGAEQKFVISLFSSKGDAKPHSSCETRAQLEKRFSTFKVRANKDGALFSPATFSQARRLKGNVIKLSLLVFDVDGGMTISEAAAKLRALAVQAFIYTTHSHQRITKDHPQAEDRFRIVIILSEPIPAKWFPALWQWMNTFFDGKLDPACKDSSRAYYLPAIASKDAPSHFRKFEGKPFDWRALDLSEESQPMAVDDAPAPIPAQPSNNYIHAAIDGEIVRLESATPGNRNNTYNKSVFNLARLGIDRGTVEAALIPIAKKLGLTDAEIKATFKSAFVAGSKRPRIINSRGNTMKTSQQTQKKTTSNNNRANAQGAAQAKQTKASGNGAAQSGGNTAGAQSSQAQQAGGGNATNVGQPRRVGVYEAKPDGLIRHSVDKQGHPLELRLTNYDAGIISDIIEDDGESQKRVYEVAARLNGRASQCCVEAENFHSLRWVDTYLGAKAITYPNQTPYAQCAIRILSPQPVERRVHTHTGWREIDSEMRYLHGGGAIGAHDVKGVEVKLPDDLKPVELPDPPVGDALKDAVISVLKLAELAADEITLPVIGGAWSAVIGGADFALWLYGRTGTFKSALAAIIQAFWGARFKADALKVTLPGNWHSSVGALEYIAHAAKDALCVIDDFKPTTRQERERLYRDADRLLRAQGNAAGRQRLTSDIRLRKTYSPRGLILVTAEEMPRFESLIARLFVIETRDGSIDVANLTTCQSLAARGVFASAMAAFIRWLAANYAEVIKGAPTAIARERDQWAQRNIATHRRYATTLAHLSYGWSLWIQFAQEVGAIIEAEALALRGRVESALATAGAKQEAHANVENPVTRFINLLLSAFASQRAHLESKDGGPPSNAIAWGWRYSIETIINPVSGKPEKIESVTPCGERIGWYADDEAYLLPDPCFALLEKVAARGEGVSVSQSTLWKHLHEADILNRSPRAEKRREYTQLRSVGGRKQNVLVLRAGSLLTCAENADTADTNED